jgi:microcystin-dependent protein
MKTSLKQFIVGIALALSLSSAAHAESYVGEVQFFANGYGAEGYVPADGRLLPMSKYPALFAIIGCDFGGDCRTNFALPNVPPMKDPSKGVVTAYMNVDGGMFPSGPARKTFGETVLMAHNIDNRENYALRRDDSITYKTLNGPDLVAYTAGQGEDKLCAFEDFTTQVKLISTLKKYNDGVMAKGQLLPIRDNAELYSLIGSAFGGDGQTTFGIPNLGAAAPDSVQAYVCTKGDYPRHP